MDASVKAASELMDQDDMATFATFDFLSHHHRRSRTRRARHTTAASSHSFIVHAHVGDPCMRAVSSKLGSHGLGNGGGGLSVATTLKLVDKVCRLMQKQIEVRKCNKSLSSLIHDLYAHQEDRSLGGSWFRLFKRYDKDNSGMLSSDEFRKVIRKDLKIKAKELPDHYLLAAW